MIIHCITCTQDVEPVRQLPVRTTHFYGSTKRFYNEVALICPTCSTVLEMLKEPVDAPPPDPAGAAKGLVYEVVTADDAAELTEILNRKAALGWALHSIVAGPGAVYSTVPTRPVYYVAVLERKMD